MKKWLTIILCVMLIAGLSACAADPAPKTPAAVPAVDYGTTTLMVFSLGNAPTEAMLATAPDLAKLNVVVCETVAADDGFVRSMAHLTADGFVEDSNTALDIVDNSAALAAFLTAAETQYPADRFGLVIVSAGYGPLVGLGDPTAFETNHLSLDDMTTALSASPFVGDNKLDFVAFDAGLTASTEIASVWSDHARFMLAAEEVLPAGGFDYGFLSDIGHHDIPSLLTTVIDRSTAAYEAYCAENGVDNAYVSLCVLDLSKTDAVINAVNTLFSAVDAAAQHTDLAAARFDAYPCGYFTTVKSYDLVDTVSLSDAMAALCPDETAALRAAVEAMVTDNRSPIPDCGGLSLYYPFSDKTHAAAWATTYASLDELAPYAAYLDAFRARWNDISLVDTDNTPAPTAEGDIYTLTLTDEQAASFVNARVWIYKRYMADQAVPQFVGGDATLDGNTLSVRVDGNTLYAYDYNSTYQVANMRMTRTCGDTTYTTVMIGGNRHTAQGYDTTYFVLPTRLDDTDGSVVTGAPVSYDTQGQFPFGDKSPLTDLRDFTDITVYANTGETLTYDADGKLLPQAMWPVFPTDGVRFTFESGLFFTKAPIETGEYFLLLQMRDAHNNLYNSAPLDISLEGILPEVEPPAASDITWTDGEAVIFDEQDVTVSLLKERSTDGECYRFKIDNRAAFPVVFTANDLIVDDTVQTNGGSTNLYSAVPAGKTLVENDAVSFGNVENFIDLNGITSIRFAFSLKNHETGQMLAADRRVRVALSDQTTFSDFGTWTMSRVDEYIYPAMGLYAEEQVICDDNGLKVTLLKLGSKDKNSSSVSALLRYENTSDATMTIVERGMTCGDVFAADRGYHTLAAGMTMYYHYYRNISSFGVTSGDAFSLAIESTVRDKSTLHLCPVALSQAGEAPDFKEGDTVVLDEQGVRIAYTGQTDDYGTLAWHFTVVNTTDKPLGIALTDKGGDVYGDTAFVPGGQKTTMTLKMSSSFEADTAPTAALSMVDFVDNAVIADFETRITLPLS